MTREARLFVLGAAMIAVHVLDDSFLQPSSGSSAGDHLAIIGRIEHVGGLAARPAENERRVVGFFGDALLP